MSAVLSYISIAEKKGEQK